MHIIGLSSKLVYRLTIDILLYLIYHSYNTHFSQKLNDHNCDYRLVQIW